MITLRGTLRCEAGLLAEIQHAAFLPLYERYRDEGNPCLRGPEDITRRLDSGLFRYFTILRDGKIAGGLLYKMSGSTPFHAQLPEGEHYLQRVYIRPELQGLHIAREAIMLAEAGFTGARALHVDFPEDLAKNRRCYEAAGYRDTGRRLEIQPGLTLAAYEKRL